MKAAPSEASATPTPNKRDQSKGSDASSKKKRRRDSSDEKETPGNVSGSGSPPGTTEPDEIEVI